MAKSTKWRGLFIGWLIAAILGTIFLAHLIYAQATGEPPVLSLSLADCMRLTLRNNLLLMQQRLDPQIKDRQVTMEESLFDPNLILSAERDHSETLTPSVLAGADVAEADDLKLDVGIEKKLVTGGSLKLDFNNQRYETNSTWQTINPYYESVLSLSLIQPLLKDFGISVTEAQIDIAVNNQRISIMELQQEMIATLSQGQKLYWDLVYSVENLRVKRLLLKQAQDVLERVIAFVEEGFREYTKVDILEAEAGVAARQEEVIIAQDSLKDAEDELKRITNLISQPGGRELSLVPTEQPSFQPREMDMEESIALALEHRPEYAQAQMELKNGQINLVLAKNRTLPKLDLNGNIGFSGLGEDYNDNWDELSTADYPIWGVGVTLTLPLGNRWAHNNHIQRKLEQEQATLKLKEIEQGIILEVRQALRQLNTNLKRIDTTRIAQQLEGEKLKIEEEKFELGMTTSHDLLEYQAQLAQAKIKQLKAIIDYNKSLIDMGTVKGTLLKEYHIELKELYPSA